MKAMSPTEFTAAMGCKSYKTATARLVALGYTDVCGRCGGSGQYSYNQIDGSRCFGCGGAGKVLAKITATTVEAALARIANGELAGYFAENIARREIKAADKALWAVYMSTTIGKAYTKASVAHVDGLLDMPIGLAQRLLNRIMDRATDALYSKTMTHVARIAVIRDATAMVTEIDSAWRDFANGHADL